MIRPTILRRVSGHPPLTPRRIRLRPAPVLLILLMAGLTPAALAQADPAGSPALPPRSGLRPRAIATLPPLPPPVGLPVLAGQVSCAALQQRIAAIVGSEAPVWSVSVADGRGNLLADLNGLQPRVPASNQKLISTAFALDRLGPDHRLSTRLWRLGDGTLRLTGQGDPDLAVPQLQRFARLAMASGGSEAAAGTIVKLQLAEEPSQNWWPPGWKSADRALAYGAPVTRLAVTSNAIEDAVSDPPSRLQILLQRAMSQQGGKARLSLVSAREPLPRDAVLLHEEPSTTMYGLLSLANTESHNFTAEVLLRTAAGSWDVDQATSQELTWLNQQGLPMQGVRIYDGSGLSRTNRLTTRFLTALLYRMDHHPYGRVYVGSMAIAGQRGTLRNLFKGTSLDGQLHAKTGTLTGVRAISGVLVTSDGPRYVSAISNGAETPNRTIGQVLRQVQNTSLCAPAL